MSIRTASTLFSLVLAFLLAAALPAQVPDLKEIEKQIPPIKLATKVDEDGLKQWEKQPIENCPACKAKKVLECFHCKHLEKPEKCPECNLTRKAPCHVCASTGQLQDPLEFAPCPGCEGHGLFPCYMCKNKGGVLWVGGGKKPQKCNVCKGNAGLSCQVCKGKRVVPSPFKGKVGQASLKDLLKAKEDLSKLIADVNGFKAEGAEGKARKDRKRFAALLKKSGSDFPVLKQVVSQVDTIIKGLDKPVEDIERQQTYAFDKIKTYLLYYLLHQSKVLDLCIERAKFNEETIAKKRG